RLGHREAGISQRTNAAGVSLEAAAKAFLTASAKEPNLGPAMVAEREIMRVVLAETKDDDAEAAVKLGITRATLKKRREQLGL
ncbi:MAG: hypothetical protein KDM63_21175, partial [Verrucomicrobiae bacterium]|nr:hypothetical protein [Verrucomicrobiae bacterium]